MNQKILVDKELTSILDPWRRFMEQQNTNSNTIQTIVQIYELKNTSRLRAC